MVGDPRAQPKTGMPVTMGAGGVAKVLCKGARSAGYHSSGQERNGTMSTSSMKGTTCYKRMGGRIACFMLVAVAAICGIASQYQVACHANDVPTWRTLVPQLLSDIQLGKIGPHRFQQLCGQPSIRVNHQDYFGLFYTDRNVVVLFRHRAPGVERVEAARQYPYAPFDQASFWEINPGHMLAPEVALEALNYKSLDS
jgi:hypothetical protein